MALNSCSTCDKVVLAWRQKHSRHDQLKSGMSFVSLLLLFFFFAQLDSMYQESFLTCFKSVNWFRRKIALWPMACAVHVWLISFTRPLFVFPKNSHLDENWNHVFHMTLCMSVYSYLFVCLSFKTIIHESVYCTNSISSIFTRNLCEKRNFQG